MRNTLFLVTTLLLSTATGCSLGPPGRESSGGLVGNPARFDTLVGFDGKSVHLSTLVQDRVALRERDGRLESSITSTEFLLLIVSRPDCSWTRRLVSEMAAERSRFDNLNCRCALVFFGETKTSAEEWKELAYPGLSLFRDLDKNCSGYYVNSRVPSFALINRWGTVVMQCEGYVSPRLLIEKMESGDFSVVEPGGG